MLIPIPADVRELLDAPNYVHLSTLRANGSPRNWVVWVGLEDERILVCTSSAVWKAKDMLRDPCVPRSYVLRDRGRAGRAARARLHPQAGVTGQPALRRS